MPARFPETEPLHGPVLPIRQPQPPVLPDDNAAMHPRWNADDEIVITGLSGRLPESSTIEEFKEQLLAGVDLITDDERRWPSGALHLTLEMCYAKHLRYVTLNTRQRLTL